MTGVDPTIAVIRARVGERVLTDESVARLRTELGMEQGLPVQCVLLDEVLMRLVDLLLVFPAIIIALVIAALLKPSFGTLLLALTITSWTPYARLARAGLECHDCRSTTLYAACANLVAYAKPRYFYHRIKRDAGGAGAAAVP